MNTDPSHTKLLFQKHLQGTALPEEIRELFHQIDQDEIDEEILASLDAELSETDPLGSYDQKRWDLVFEKIKDDTAAIEKEEILIKKKVFGFRRIGIAAAIALTIFGAGFYFFKNDKDQFNQSVYVNDVAPGKMGATLTLANGKKIRLSDVNNGEIAKEAGISVTKTTDGHVAYSVSSLQEGTHETSSGQALKQSYNTLTTAKGETYILTLPDKSKVWMNAGSSLTYSAALIEHGARKVKLDGEAYFEIAKDKDHPFIVSTNQQEVEVLGTHFNINSYNPIIKTTLLEGSVKISELTSHRSNLLQPGQQATLINKGFVIGEADTEQAVAWKNGYFRFNNDNIETIMLQLTLWYDIEVRYEGKATDEKFYGKISRFKNISKVLLMLEKSKGVHFKVEGRRVTVIG